MGETFFFAKEVPQTPLFMRNGRKLTFDSVDGQVGFTMTGDPNVAGELNNFARSGVGGVRPASREEYEEFVKKKSNSPRQPLQWRDELRPTSMSAHDTILPVVDAKPTEPILAPTAPSRVNGEARADLGEPFKPRTVPRKKGK